MVSAICAGQEANKMAVVGPTPFCEARGDKGVEAVIVTRTAIRAAPMTWIETLLDKVDDSVLASLWRQVCPPHVDRLPDRRGIIADLADFAEVLQPRSSGIRASQLCRLIAATATQRRRSQRFLRELLCDVNAGQRRVRGSSGLPALSLQSAKPVALSFPTSV